MKKLMRVRTNAYDMLVTYDDEEMIVRFLTDSSKIDTRDTVLEEVEDDSSWDIVEDVENINEWLDGESEIIEEIEVEF